MTTTIFDASPKTAEPECPSGSAVAARGEETERHSLRRSERERPAPRVHGARGGA